MITYFAATKFKQTKETMLILFRSWVCGMQAVLILLLSKIHSCLTCRSVHARAHSISWT
jgi:hypothetical protein